MLNSLLLLLWGSLATFSLMMPILWFGSVQKVQQNGFDWSLANTTLWLSAAAYCGADTYMNRTYKGYSSGFRPTLAIDASRYDTQGFVGVMESKSSIYVVFRGSTSRRDWINNMDTAMTAYPNCSNCYAHSGFYRAERAVSDAVTRGVQDLLLQYPTFTVVVTGHSLGGALATLIALTLIKVISNPVQLINYGSPRVGNKNFAVFASDTIQTRYRVTHYRDIVPHLPWTERFVHISGEWYEDEDGNLHECSGYEDRHCSYQWYYLTEEDHLVYLGFKISSCDAVS